MPEIKEVHGIDCPCDECKAIRQLIKMNVKSGNVHLVGLEKDKKKVMEGD